MAIQTEIEALDSTEEHVNYRAELEDLFIAVRVTINLRDAIKARVKLVCKVADYWNFITSFQEVVDQQESLLPTEKFNHLTDCLRGAALETIKAFQVTTENYSKAYLA